mmetsp:Transcript_37894/g.82554  ORF Transcript_37894/g.82554 Transcript_37894/m.82554 type:complete len:232 (-) Transcript_37894:1732-2427(-)
MALQDLRSSPMGRGGNGRERRGGEGRGREERGARTVHARTTERGAPQPFCRAPRACNGPMPPSAIYTRGATGSRMNCHGAHPSLDILIILGLVLAVDGRWLICPQRSRAHLAVVLAGEVDLPAHDDVLLLLQQLDAVRHRRQRKADQVSAEEHEVLKDNEENDTTGVAPILHRVGGENHERGVRHHSHCAHDVEGRVPGLVVGRGQREGPPVQHDELLLAEEAIDHAGQEG